MAAQLEAAVAKGDLNAVKDLMTTSTIEDLNKVYNNASGKKTMLNRVRSKGPAYAPIGRLLEQYGALSYENSSSKTVRNLAKYQHAKRLAKNEGNNSANVFSNVAQAGNIENMSPLVSPVPYARHKKTDNNSASISSNVAQAGNFEDASPLVSPLTSAQYNEEDSVGLHNPESPQAGNYLVTPPVSPRPQPQQQVPRRLGVITVLSESTTVSIPIKLATEIIPGKKYYISRYPKTHIDSLATYFIQHERGGPLTSSISGMSFPVIKVNNLYKVIDSGSPTQSEEDRTYNVYTASGGGKTRHSKKRIAFSAGKRKTRSSKNKKNLK